ncbi:putative mediator of RNA polymerase II transcription subunit 12 [Drosophila elegans]|uniref:putative mediator of RNA polymerase II transcription subunit 12 n=1 Tax=Drosophila elegans TaxID=30023 RepID=UPI0007E6EFB7|nr:putative mediator of RNA polymerase II transcription subunit 12 [Drosophila elegans]
MTQIGHRLAPLLEALLLFVLLVHRVQCDEHSGPRVARIMQFLSEPQPHFSHHNRPPPGAGLLPRIRSRSDSLPTKFLRSPQPATVQHIMRREQFGNFPANDQLRRYQFDQNQSGRFAHVKDTPVLDVGKNQFPPQYFSEQYMQNFKSSPHFNGNVIMKDQKPAYAPIQQHAIPVQASQYLHYPKLFGQQGAGFSVVPSQQTASQYQKDANSYSVYEDSENLPKQGVNYRQAVPPAKESKEAQDYLQFMSTNEYFLPKRDPDYRRMDTERDQQKQLQQYPQQYNQQQQQQHKQPQQHQQLQHQPQPQQHQSLKQHLPYKIAGPDNSVSSSYNEPIQVSDLFYQQDPAPANAAVVRGSYQAGQDVFVVKSDGNKAVKHVVSTPMSVQASTQTPPKSQHPAKSHKSYTPEPLRFEFTEQDAIRGSMKYTQSPATQANQYYYETVAQAVREPAKASSPILQLSKPIKEYSDDPEDSADTDSGKQQEDAKVSTGTSAATPGSPKDTESYCEKICANVYDENDEIICGSDGYMYTGETQLQCYSSCLNISVTIKSKGSCS